MPPKGPGPMPGFVGRDKVSIGPQLKRFFVYARRYIPAIAVAAVLAFAGTILNLIGPSKLGDMTDVIAAGLEGAMDMEVVTRLAVLLLALYVGGVVLSYGEGLILTSVVQRLNQKMRADLSDKVDRLPLRYLDSMPTGNVLSLATNDVDSIGRSLNQSMSSLLTAAVQIVGSLILMFATNALMALAGVGTALLGMAITVVIVAKSQKYFVAQQEALGKVDSQVEEVMGGLDVVHISSAEKAQIATFDKLNGQLYEVAYKAAFLSSTMMPLMGFIGNLGYVAVCIVGGALAMNGSIPFGTVVAFMVYIRLFTQPLQTIAQASTSVQTMAAACKRVFDFLDQEELADEGGKTAKLENIEGKVEFDHVCFGYKPGQEVIHDFSATALPGQKVAIVGPTGAGKTTIVNLLMRFYEVDGGEIRIDGVPTQQVTRRNLHEQFGMVLQDTWFFEGTLRENIAFDTPDVTDDVLERACEAVGLSGFVASLPQGFDTRLDPSVISAGQRQLITIARAMVKNAPLLILDEATSSVDTRTERRVQQAMDALMRRRTSFVIAHRLSTIRDADLILVMEQGEVVESGTHEGLLARGGAYARLYNAQFTV